MKLLQSRAFVEEAKVIGPKAEVWGADREAEAGGSVGQRVM